MRLLGTVPVLIMSVRKPGGGGGNRGGGGKRGGGGPRPGGPGMGAAAAGAARGPRVRRGEAGKDDKAVEVEGTISSVLAGTMFRVKLPSGHEVLAHISGKMRKRFIRLVIGDRVKMEMSPYDTAKARIVYRLG